MLSLHVINDTGFPCVGCGACCRSIAGTALSHPDRSDGTGVNLQPDSSYEFDKDHPLLCRVDKNIPPDWSKEDWYSAN